MTASQRRVVYIITLGGGLVSGIVLTLKEPGPFSLTKLALYTITCLLGGYTIAKLLMFSPADEDDEANLSEN